MLHILEYSVWQKYKISHKHNKGTFGVTDVFKQNATSSKNGNLRAFVSRNVGIIYLYSTG